MKQLIRNILREQFSSLIEISGPAARLSNDEFIKRANKVHKDFCDYSLVDYKNMNSKVQIICPIHGVFEQYANAHLKGVGCPKCKGGVRSNRDEFIEKAKKIYGDKYQYDNVEYKNAATKVEILCPNHGLFFVSPNNLFSL
jgi:hypothetical protein